MIERVQFPSDARPFTDVSWLPGGQLFSVMGFTVRGGRIVEIDVLSEPARLSRLDLTVFNQ